MDKSCTAQRTMSSRFRSRIPMKDRKRKLEIEGNRLLETQFVREQDDEQRENDKGASYRKWKELVSLSPEG